MRHSDRGPVRYSGACLCGAVRLTVFGEALFVAHCQCLDCRRTSGTGHSTDAGFRLTDVDISGEMTGYDSTARSGNRIARSFCGVCGSKISTGNSASPDEVALNLAVLDDPGLLTPDTVYFTRSAIDWDLMDPGLKAYDTQP